MLLVSSPTCKGNKPKVLDQPWVTLAHCVLPSRRREKPLETETERAAKITG